MESLLLKSFKAHKELEIKFDNKSFLLYGDNGAGKSSIYDALKIKFFENKIEDNIESSNYAEEVSDEDKNEFFSKYNNSILNNKFEIIINNGDISYSEYQVFMLNLEDTNFSKYLNFNTLIGSVYFNILADFNFDEIEYNVNKLLINFKEDIRITIDREDFSIRIIDTRRKLVNIKDIKRYFNEAKLNLVVLALLFSMVELYQDEDKKRVLILDDFITSLDMSNRTFLMKYILETFGEKFQIIILTHNVYFYNLIMYLVNDIYKVKDNWQYANLYEIGSEYNLYMNSVVLKISDIQSELNLDNPNFQTIGNQIRQKFERLLYEFSKTLMIGAVEESNKILELIENSQHIYLKKQGNKSSNELILEIQNILNEGNPQNLNNRLQNKIDNYKLEDLQNIQNILRELKLYRKVSMHSLSHGRIGQSTWSKKEIEQSLTLLIRLEGNINRLDTSEQRRTDGL